MESRGPWRQVGWNVLLAVASLALGILLLSLAWQVIEPRLGGQVPAIAPASNEQPGIVQVEVRNGAGVSGLARDVTNHLRAAGFDVKEFGDWSRFDVEATLVLDRVGDPAAAARVARALGLDQEAIMENLDARPLVDVTVVIGHDYHDLAPFTNRPRR